MLKKIDIENILYKFILIMMILLPLGKLLAYCLYLGGIIKDSFDFNQVYVLWYSIPILAIIYLFGIFTKKFQLNKMDYITYGLIIFAFISTFVAKDRNISVYGELHRNEGLLTLLNYYLLFLNIKNIKTLKYQKNLINCFIYLGVFQVIYSVFQVYTSVPFVRHYSRQYMAMGLCANPNFLGSYMVMLTSITSILYLLENKKRYLYLSFIFFFGICLGSSTGPFLGYVLGFLFFILFYNKRFCIKKLIVLIISFVIIFFAHDASIHYVEQKIREKEIDRYYNIKYDIIDTVNSQVQPNIEYSLGNGRIKLWERLLPVAKEYFWLGAGIDNLRLVYPQNYLLIFDKAHNIYLQILITNGIFALILYCLLCLIIFIKGFKIKEPCILACYIAFIAYSIQGFANISVIDVAPYFFIILGILSSNIENIRLNIFKKNLQKVILR